MANNVFNSDGKAIIAVFVGVIIAAVLLTSISDSIFNQTNTFTLTNESVVVGAVNVSVATTGRDLVGVGLVTNSTNASQGQFTGLIISDGLISGSKTIFITANDTATDQVGETVNVSYTYNPDGYLTDSGTRSIATLIILFGALAALIFTIVVFIKNGSLGEIMRGTRSR
ncbi:hypothetical protein LCGC14_0476480 [marine sediment metagenome]|uniref:Uncharacterized protein n=1 Tax=marine sediment metagenome TaxID=412755 RepID=A0A0F9SAM3_9ZZZZ